MTYVRLAGGLGNQFFQILHAFICSKTDDPIIILTNSLKEFKTPRSPDFYHFIHSDRLQISSKPSLLTDLLVSKLRIGKIQSYLYARARPLFSIFFSRSSGFHFPIVVDGYFQEPTQFEINRFFDLVYLKKPHCFDQLQSLASLYDCCLHVRGGDFLHPENSHLNICNFDYYLSAVESAFSDGFVKILIIGDDMQYSQRLQDYLCKKMPFCSFSISDQSSSAVNDFQLMTCFQSFILSSSTFAWWAALISCNKHQNVTVYGPGLFEINRKSPQLPCKYIKIDL